MDTRLYLQRIEVAEPVQQTLEGLTQLQKRHVTRVPFENLDILHGIPIALRTGDLFDKLVNRRRGGVCYELNGLFSELLRRTGFETHMIAATVYQGEGKWGTEGSHATNLVRLEGRPYLVDVGFGGNSPRRPVPITGEEIQDADGFYRISPYPELRNGYILEKKEERDWNILYRFDLEPKQLEDFAEVCDVTQYAPESPFNKVYFLMKVTEAGRMTLFDHSLTVVDGPTKTKETIEAGRIDDILERFLAP
ncbi:arylamine N-acetyltransferase [Paenibacillus sp. MZ04-78.2]|uniref:arylamine N-acetyltransferase family protein n=1 Tax=Paenibacillus sp. MZ04-78.2 TaxID=2962034 RepID=UPI0020B6EA8A|nr:arylamine N-acetyltransferase [Paenibacillus sp. MZ04-78.2]MCP3775592.1 arylamine N-acetyltransferase [Paenibacillus sp. MZ04-78.2]